MNVVVLGASGQIGRAVMQAIPGARGVSRPEADILDAASVERACHGADAVILTAALTAVDYCEDHPDEARAVNVEGTRHVARHAPYLVYLSTEYVFDGRSGPYSEEDVPAPQSVYARTKLEGEAAAREARRCAIVRTTVVYSWLPGSKNFLMQALAGRPMRVPRDQVSSPTLADNLAAAVAEIAERRLDGIWNIAGADVMDRYSFAQRIARRFRLDVAGFTPVSTAELGQKAARPLNAGLRIDKARRELRTRLLTVDEGLEAAWRQRGAETR